MKVGTRGFAIGALVLACAVIGVRLAIGSCEWFYGDDFYFLTWVRDARWSWRETFLPTSARLIAGYRPLGLDGYFVANFELFGWNALGYYITGLALQALTGFAVVRIAQQYGLDSRIALAAGLFVLCATPSTTATYEVANHNYLGAAAATALALTWFLDYVQRGRARDRWASCAMFTIAVLSNEISASMPFVAFAAAVFASSGPLHERARKSALALGPHLVIGVLFLDFRLSGVPKSQLSWFYDVDVSLDMLSNTRGNLAYAMGGTLELCAALVLLATGAAIALRRLRRGPKLEAASPAAQLATISVLWLATMVTPFSVLALPTTRFALVLLPPLALLLATSTHVLLPLLRPAWQTPALLVALVLLTPWQTARERLERPKGAAYRQAHAVAARALRTHSMSSCVTVVCNGPGLANASQCAGFRDGSFHTGLWTSVAPDRGLEVAYSESGSENFLEQVRNVHDCIRFYLRPDLSVSTEPPRGAFEGSLLSARFRTESR